MITIKKYANKRNPHKVLEIHCDGYGHYSFRQKVLGNYVGDGKLHRMNKSFLDTLIQDYHLFKTETI